VSRNLSRYLCRQCDSLQRVKFTDDDGTLHLECGHSRPKAMPLVPGRISLENVTSELGQKMFPLQVQVAQEAR
jgi:hypothetical protein